MRGLESKYLFHKNTVRVFNWFKDTQDRNGSAKHVYVCNSFDLVLESKIKMISYRYIFLHYEFDYVDYVRGLFAKIYCSINLFLGYKSGRIIWYWLWLLVIPFFLYVKLCQFSFVYLYFTKAPLFSSWFFLFLWKMLRNEYLSKIQNRWNRVGWIFDWFVFVHKWTSFLFTINWTEY